MVRRLDSLKLSQACEGFIRYKTAIGKSTNTLADYRNSFLKLRLFFKDDPPFVAIDRGQLIEFFSIEHSFADSNLVGSAAAVWSPTERPKIPRPQVAEFWFCTHVGGQQYVTLYICIIPRTRQSRHRSFDRGFREFLERYGRQEALLVQHFVVKSQNF